MSEPLPDCPARIYDERGINWKPCGKPGVWRAQTLAEDEPPAFSCGDHPDEHLRFDTPTVMTYMGEQL